MLKKLLLLMAALSTAAAFAAVDVNTATVAELDGIKGIGPGISGKILAERRNGPFADWNDFRARVRGIGEVNAVRFSEQGLRVNGKGFNGARAHSAATDSAPRPAPPRPQEENE
jgi:competence protein ComEA